MRKPERLLLLVTVLYIFFGVLNFQSAWMQPEAGGINAKVLEIGKGFGISDLKLGLNYPLFEYAPRTHRPLSSYFEIVDARFRAGLWHIVPPHPSFSLSWIFLLVLCPIMLFRFLRAKGVSEPAAMCAAALFLASPGTLSLTAMLFRPGKPMTNFAILLALDLGARYQERLKSSIKAYLSFLMVLFVSFFWDETALLAYPAFLLFFPRVAFKSVGRALAFLSLPGLTYLAFFRGIPALTAWAGFERPDLMSYWPLARTMEHQSFPEDLIPTFKLFVMDSLGLTDPSLIPGWGGKLLVIGAFAATGALICFSLYSLVKNRKAGEFFFSSLLGVVGAGLSQAVLSGGNQHPGWGIFWYGTYWTVFFSIFLGVLLDRLNNRPRVAVQISAILIGALLFIFPFTNRIYKNAHYGRYQEHPEIFTEMFENRYNRFTASDLTSPGLFSKTLKLWWDARTGKPCRVEAPELVYLRADLGCS